MAKKKPQGQKAAANDLETEDDFPTPGSDDQVDQAAAAADEQQAYEAQTPPNPKAPREESASGKSYRDHPKFSKFRRERS